MRCQSITQICDQMKRMVKPPSPTESACSAQEGDEVLHTAEKGQRSFVVSTQ